MDDNLKKPALTAALAFCWSAMAYQFFFNMGAAFSYGKLAIATAIGLAVAAVVFAVAKMLNK